MDATTAPNNHEIETEKETTYAFFIPVKRINILTETYFPIILLIFAP